MSTFTFRVTSSATNVAGDAYGQQPDLGAPSFLDLIVSNSTDPVVVNGVYDAYCLNPLIDIFLSPNSYPNSFVVPGNGTEPIVTIDFEDLTRAQLDAVNWLLAQNFTSDPKYGNQFNFGEVQTAIWKLVGFTDAQINGAGLQLFLNDNNRQVVSIADVNFLVSSAQNAAANGATGTPENTFFTAIVDTVQEAQPLIIQLQKAKLGNYVWLDSDADGIQDANEAGVNNVVVELYDGNGTLLATTTTGDDLSTAAVESGYYQFTGLAAGNYQVKFIAPSYQFTSQDANGNTQDALDSDANGAGFSQIVTLAAGQSNQTIDAGVVLPPQKASLGDYVWLDNNQDGQQNDGAASGVNGVVVNLLRPDGTFVATTTTANDGSGNPGYYLFSNLVPGDYKVEFVKPAGYTFTTADQGSDGGDSDADVSTGQTISTTLVAGENDLSWDAGLLKLASLGDKVWEDKNANGQQDDGEPGIDGVTVRLYNCVTNELLATQVTANGGIYNFTGLPPGTYHVVFETPNGFVQTQVDVGGDATDSDAGVGGVTGCYTLASGDNNTTVDAGFYRTASLGNYVWLDDNNNGVQDEAAAKGVNGVVVNLLRPDGTFVATTTTADDGSGNPGYYLFSNLVPGDYKVEFVKPAGYIFAKQDQGGDASDSDADTTTGVTISTTLESGENDLSWDAGLLKLASLGDKVWEDKNANGQQDDGEPGIDGVTVRLYNCVTNELLATQVTANGGIYNFTGLPPGTYHVVFETPNGFVQTQVDVGGDATDSDAGAGGVTGCYTLASGDNNTTVDAGFYRTASLGNYVWLDDNNNGVQDEAAAKGVNGVVVNLLRPDGTFVATTTTANDGSGNPGYYLFSNLVPGDYKVEFVKPAGYIFAKQDQGGDASDSDADTTTGVTISTTLESGENDLSWDAGLLKLASLGDKVWEDKNANGQQDDGEPGIDGVTVRLYNCVTNELVATQVTANGGIYNFTGLPPGTYHVVFETPNGFVQTQVDVGGDATDSDAGAGGVTGCYTLASGDNNTTVDAGFYRTASLGNYVWLDDNNNGVQDEAAAKGVNGVVVNLLRPDGTFVATTTTADDGSGNPGYYLFSNLVPGDYKVEFVKPAGYIFAKQDQGGDASDSDADTTTGVTISTTLESGENDLSWDAGLLKLASLGDKVWEDKNANGQQDDGEPGIDGVTVRLYNCVTNELLATQVTANGGIYNFTGLPPGTYHVVFETPNGFVQTQVDVGGDATDSDAGVGGVTGCYTLASGDNNTTVDAGFYKLARLGDYVWADNNLNGLQDDGQTGVNGVTVRLLRPDGTVVATTVTANDANNNPGYYFFGNLVPGDYKVEFVKPAGYAFTSADQGANDGTDSDANTSTGQTIVTTLVSGENDLSWDAGLVKLASLGDYVWEDKNADGIQNDGATGINGVTVRLLRPDGTLVATTVTATNAGNAGYYFFGDLLPGDYKVEFVKPNGYSFSAADQGGNDGLDSDANVNNGQTVTTTLTAGENDLSWDAGLYKLASLGDYVWADNNLNGLQDDGQTGVNGVTVRLLRPDGTVVATTVTANDANNNPGYYFFGNLVPGDYKVEFVKPAGYAFTSADQGANDGTDSDANTSTGQTIVTTLVSGENDLSWDAGLVKLASLGDYVWEDKNADGIQNDGATGINGVTVRLLRPDGTLVATTVTATNAGNAGYYFFGNLLPGDYKVEFVKPTGYKFTTADVGADGLDSDANVSTGQTISTTLTAGENDLSWDAGLIKLAPAIDIEKTTNGPTNSNPVAPTYDNEDTATGAGVAILTAGSTVNWTYKVTNTGNTSFAYNDIAIVDDNGTVGNTADDMSVANGKITFLSVAVGNNDNVLDAGEVWLYQASGIVQNLGGTAGASVTLDFSGNTALDGTDGNIRSYSNGVVSVNASAFSRDKTTGAWSAAYLGAYGGGLGVTDSSEGDGSGDAHTVDNIGRDNYVLFEFNQNVIVDSAYLGYVVGDSDIKIWIGTTNNPFSSHVTLSDAVLSAMGFTEVNATTLTTARLADLNAGGYAGNTLIIAADTTDTSPEDRFKIDQVTVQQVQGSGVYANKATVSAPGTVGDSDMSHYKNPEPIQPASIGDRVWYDKNANGIQDAGEAGVAGVRVELRSNGVNGVDGGNVLATTTTDANGNYLFSNLVPGGYHIDIDESTLPSGFIFTKSNVGSDAADSDVRSSASQPLIWGIMDNTTLDAGENDRSWDAGVYKVGIDVEKYVSGTVCTTVNNCSGEGQTVSYWKSNCKWDSSLGNYGWTGTGVKYNLTFNSVFGVNCTGGTRTLYEVLCSTGTTSQEKMMRECVAAYLNACHTNVDYSYSKEQVCAQTKYAINCGSYDNTCNAFQNENNLGCNFTTTKTTWNCTVDSTLYDVDAAPGLELKVGSTAVFTYIVKNTGDTALKNVVLTDDRITAVNYVSGDTNGNGWLDVSETWTYKAQETVVAGTIKNTGTVTGIDAVGGVAKVTDADDAYYTGYNTSSTKGSLGDRVWEDKNFNGVQDAGESGVSGVKVTLRGAGANGVFGDSDDVTSVTYTNASGNYEFNNLAAGKYKIEVTTPSSYFITKQNQGANDATDSDIGSTGVTSEIVLGAGEHNMTIDAGIYRKASVGDKVWDDMDHDNVQDASEPGIANIVVKLLNSAGAVIKTTTTNSNGNYLFNNLDPGTYSLQFDKTNVMHYNYGAWYNMNNWKWAKKDQGTNDAIDSDVNGDAVSTTNVTVTSQFTLVSGQADMTKDAGITPIVIDLNGDGIQTVSRADAGGVFDLFGNGSAVASGWISGSDAFLAVDKNGNGRIDDIGELFGGTAKGAGFANLASYDSNGDGLVNDLDTQFGQLMVWQDANGNHVTDAGELVGLAQAGVASLTVAYTEVPFLDAQGNLHLERSAATLADGSSVDMTDVYFNVSADDAAAAGVALPTLAELLGDSRSLDALLGASGAAPVALAAEDGASAAGDAAEILRRLASMTQHDAHQAVAA